MFTNIPVPLSNMMDEVLLASSLSPGFMRLVVTTSAVASTAYPDSSTSMVEPGSTCASAKTAPSGNRLDMASAEPVHAVTPIGSPQPCQNFHPFQPFTPQCE